MIYIIITAIPFLSPNHSCLVCMHSTVRHPKDSNGFCERAESRKPVFLVFGLIWFMAVDIHCSFTVWDHLQTIMCYLTDFLVRVS